MFKSVPKIGLLAMITAGTGWLFDSYVINAYTYNLALIQKAFSLSLGAVGVITSIYLIGYALGTLLGGTIADYFGRKTALIFSILWYVVSAVLTGFSAAPWMLGGFRLLTGIGAGGELPVSSTFITDTWPAAARNRGTGLMNMGYPLGYLLMIGISALVLPIWGWRAVFFLAVIPAILVVVIRLKVTESPAFIRVQQTLQRGQKRKFTWQDVVSPEFRRPFVAQTLIWIGNGFTFWSFVAFVPLYLIKAKGLLPSQVALFLLAWNIFYILLPYLTAWLSDKTGRRFAGGLTAACALVGIWALGSLSFSPIGLFVVGGLTYGLYACPWIVGFTFSTESFPTEIRGSAISVVMTVGRVVSIAAPIVVGGLAVTLGFGNVMKFAGLMWLVTIVGFALAPETLGRPLADFVRAVPVITQQEELSG